MSLSPLPGFQHFTTHHCVTGSMRHIYVFNHHPLSEDLLLGLGSGIGFIYWHTRGQAPFIGGRGSPQPSFEELIGQRTGVQITPHTSSSQPKARQALLEILASGQPAMLQVDMGYLPYFDFHGTDYHFGGHAIVVCGYDPDIEQVLVADRDESLHTVPMPDLQKSRSSTFKPFPPHNRWYTFDFSHKRQPTQKEIYQAITEQANSMLNPPISNLGVAGIRKAAKMLPTWSETMSADELRWALFNTYIFVSPVGGSGGGLFRFMFSRFLKEVAQISGEISFEESQESFYQVATKWEQFGNWCKQTSEDPNRASRLGDGSGLLNTIAELEETAWRKLSNQLIN
jgi:hypothetical protein